MTEPIAYLKGEYVPMSQCLLPIHDLGILMAAAVTDVLRTFQQRPYRLQDHLERLYQSCKGARIEPPVGRDEAATIAERLIRENIRSESFGSPNAAAELGLVFYVTAGDNPSYVGLQPTAEASGGTLVAHPVTLRLDRWCKPFRSGAHCVTPSTRHWPAQCLSAKIKNRNRLHMWIAQHEVQAVDPAAVPLFLDLDGHLTETTNTNFVIYRDGRVISPRRRNILWGVSLAVLTEILDELGVPFVEEDIQPYDAINADEAWMPTTTCCLAPVTKINGVPIGSGAPGPMWRKVLSHWSEQVGKDVHAEVMAAAKDGG